MIVFINQSLPTMNIQPTVAELVNNISRLEEKEFEKLVKKLAVLQMQRRGTMTLPAEESELLQNLNRGFAVEKWERLKYLDWKSEFGSLNRLEEEESLRLAEEYESLSVQRLKMLSKLADLRNVSVDELAMELGIKTNFNA